MHKHKDTRFELVEELQKVPSSPQIEEIIREAKAGEYHDYKNQKYACGKVTVVGKLRQAGLPELARRVMDGEFDEQPDAEDIAEMKKDLPPHLWKALFESGPNGH